MRLNLQTFLPEYVCVRTGKGHDSLEAERLCAGVKAGEIVVFDKAYVVYEQLFRLEERGVFWVTRAKENMQYRIVEDNTPTDRPRTKADYVVELTIEKSSKAYPKYIRLVRQFVTCDGKDVEMTFITNNMSWAPRSIADLYQARWNIETFFKEMKQNLQLCDFLGYSENAVRWQVWTALLTLVLLRAIERSSQWTRSFTRLFTAVRGVLWNFYSMEDVLKLCCGTADRPPPMRAHPDQLYLPGFEPT